jgi:3-dehydroquinate synthase
MSTIVHVDLGERSYDIRIGAHPGSEVMRGMTGGRRVLIVSDDNVDPLYGDSWSAQCDQYGLEVFRATVPAGESSKDLQFTTELYEKALDAGLDRGSMIVALGGGMVGDLAGFVAATFLRGIPLIQAPTSLLAMVDSSVGGKTGVNLPRGKNLVGVFYQPHEVVLDLSTLTTLPDDEYASGLAEIVKYGVIWDAELFRELENKADRVLKRDPQLMEYVVTRCCEIKAEVVGRDEKESGLRAILNYGHTLGHAIEQVYGYGAWLHGQAISLGMVYAGELSRRAKGFPVDDQRRVIALLEHFGLPVESTNTGLSSRWGGIRSAMAADKKSRDAVPHFVLAEAIGTVAIGCAVDDSVLEDTYRECFGE